MNSTLSLEPNVGKHNLYRIRDRAVNFIARTRTLLGEGADGSFLIRSTGPLHKSLKEEVLSMMSAVLLQCPLVGSDGAAGKRTYHAYPGDYRQAPGLLRELGKSLAPPVFDPKKVVDLILDKYEAYKLEISIPSNLIGFNLDIGKEVWRGSEPIRSLYFTCFDGGMVYPNSRGLLTEVGIFKMNIVPDQNIAGTLAQSAVINVHDIDKY